jgi:hypothetical protein
LQVAVEEALGWRQMPQEDQGVEVLVKVILQALDHLLEFLEQQQQVQVAVEDLMEQLVVLEQVDL